MYHSLQTSIQVYHVLLLLVSSHDFEPIFIIFSSELKNTVRPAQIKTNHQNLWHVTSILVCCIFGLVDVAAALFVTSEVGTQRCLWSWSKVRVDAPKGLVQLGSRLYSGWGFMKIQCIIMAIFQHFSFCPPLETMKKKVVEISSNFERLHEI